MGKHLRLMKKHEIKENIIYLALWGILFLAPVLTNYLRTLSDTHASFQWTEIGMVWRSYAFFLVVFLVHNFLLAPLLVYKHRKALYFSLVTLLVGVFFVYHCTSHHGGPMPGERPGMEEMHRPPMHGMAPPPKPSEKGFKPHDGHRPPMMFGQHDVVMLVVMVLMLGMNLGVKLYFKADNDAKQMDELANKNLEQQLEYLKYQINPHFFMNTLNNIHALVDINPEKAKDTILELSKLMRYVLYEGAKPQVPLLHEVNFLNNYITLMKIRYTDHVRITVNTPASVPDKNVPPLLFITFVENAFKHGVSYQRESFIDVTLLTEGDRVKFVCRNSKTDEDDDTHGGVGLANVRKRLDLIYGNDYMLDITDEPGVYDVRLGIPLL